MISGTEMKCITSPRNRGPRTRPVSFGMVSLSIECLDLVMINRYAWHAPKSEHKKSVFTQPLRYLVCLLLSWRGLFPPSVVVIIEGTGYAVIKVMAFLGRVKEN
eukprot:3853024-Amphidinium_carterae.1